jgi:large subunit ribosomal protein L24
MAKACVKKGDTVKILAGKEKGKSGKIVRVIPKECRVVVEKLNMVKRHSKPSAKNRQGGIVDKEAPIHWSNVVRVQDTASAK